MKATMDQLKEDKNLKWLAEIYARSEARRLISTSTSADMKTNSDRTPKAYTKRHYPSSASVIESSIILPASSPSHRHSTRSTPKRNHDIVMTDTTNQLSSASASPSSSMLPDTQEKKVKLKAEVVDKLRNDLFRNTILKLVKDGTIVVFPADLSASSTKSHSTGIVKQECAMCKEQNRKEMERIPPIMTMDGIPLREYDSFEGESEQRKDDGSKCPHTSSIPKAAQHTEETYALMTMELVMPLVEKVLSRMDTSLGVDVDYLVGAVRRSDDMFRFVSRETVKECLDFSGGRSN